MPDVARQRVSFGTRGSASGRQAAVSNGEPEVRAARSDSNSPQAFEGRRPRGATGRFMNRLDLSMRAVSVQWLMGSLGAIAALLTALSIPIGYAVIGYLNGSETLSVKAEVSGRARRAFHRRRPFELACRCCRAGPALGPRDSDARARPAAHQG